MVPRFPEIDVALRELIALEHKLNDPDGQVDSVVAEFAVRIAIVSLQTVADLNDRGALGSR